MLLAIQGILPVAAVFLTKPAVDSLSAPRDDIEGAISSVRLRPGESASDLMMFEPPLEKARRFRVVSDPGFYRNSGDGLLHPLSSDGFELEFTRDAIK